MARFLLSLMWYFPRCFDRGSGRLGCAVSRFVDSLVSLAVTRSICVIFDGRISVKEWGFWG